MADFELSDVHLKGAGIDLEPIGDTTQDDKNETNGTDTQGASTQASSSPQTKVEGASGKDSLVSDPNSSTQPGKKEEGKGTSDPDLKPGDIKLPNGEIVRAGPERRHFENARIFKAETIDLKNQLNTVTQKHTTLQEKYNTLEQTVKTIGLEDAPTVSNAIRLYKDLRSDPKATVTKLLAELKAAGHTVDGIGSAVDTAAIQNLIDARLPAKSNEVTPEQKLQAIQEEADRETREFLTQYPDARMHEQMIAAIIENEANAGRDVNLRDVYFKLRQSAVNQGFDWNQPLGPQIEAKKSQQQQQHQSPRPIVNGRTGVDAGSTDQIDPLKSSNGYSKDDVILAAMRDGGYSYTR